MAKDTKRKRESDAAEHDDQQPPRKSRAVGDDKPRADSAASKNKDGEKRQLKSERRKKKKELKVAIKTAKQNHRRETRNRVLANKDGIANGQDFVSLTAPVSSLKEKRRSPRAIRKERIQKMKEEANAVSESTIDPASQRPDRPKAEARFICFVGNLPFTATVEQIEAHFAKLEPSAVRLSTDKKSGKSKGFAFLEFENYDRMKTCLKLYHHSIFDPESGSNEAQDPSAANSASKGRKINVELTAGGGGRKSEGRKEKIKKKNFKLNEQRARDWEKKKVEEKATGRPDKRRILGQDDAHPNQDFDTANSGDRGDIHPSRLGRVRA